MVNIKMYYLVCCIAVPSLAFSQTFNEGILSVLPDTEIATLLDFSNEKEGVVYNDGTFYFYAHFNNDGIYTYGDKRKSSYGVFQSSEENSEDQLITGSSPTEFYDVLFDNRSLSPVINLKNDMSIGGTANFKEGVILIDSLKGAMVFQKGAKSINASNESYVDGEIEKIGNDEFVYPIGQGNLHRHARISAPRALEDAFLAKYYLKNSDKEQPHASKAGGIKQINHKEYWTIERENKTKSNIILTLSWDAVTIANELLENPEKNLHILRWDELENIWVDEGGIVDVLAQTVTTPTFVSGYGIFTLGIFDNQSIEGDLVIYNAVTPNGDGHNDHFVIDNIERFPNNRVEVFNRWGEKVYSTRGYNNTDNNFTGYSDGRVTVNKGEALPTGTYYYIVEYEYSDAGGSRMIKKAGYLHLETE